MTTKNLKETSTKYPSRYYKKKVLHTMEKAGVMLISTKELATTSAINTPNTAATTVDKKHFPILIGILSRCISSELPCSLPKCSNFPSTSSSSIVRLSVSHLLRHKQWKRHQIFSQFLHTEGGREISDQNVSPLILYDNALAMVTKIYSKS